MTEPQYGLAITITIIIIIIIITPNQQVQSQPVNVTVYYIADTRSKRQVMI